MENLGFLLVALVCPLTMGLMMLLMMRRGDKRGPRRERAEDDSER